MRSTPAIPVPPTLPTQPAPPQPAPRGRVVLTGAALYALFALVLPPLNGRDDVLGHILFLGWVPALLIARLGWAAHTGAIRQRVGERFSRVEPREREWTIHLRNPRVITARDNIYRFQIYFLFEAAVTVVVFLMTIGALFAPVLRMVGLVVGADVDG